MIESHIYKADLLRFAAALRVRQRRQLWRGDSLSIAERMMYVGFYFVRKLLESGRVTTACTKLRVQCERASITPRYPITEGRRWDIMDYINDCQWHPNKIRVEQLASTVIHSWWDIPAQGDNGGLEGFLLTTDKRRNAEIFYLPTATIVDVFERFGNDWPRKIETGWDESGQMVYRHLE